MIHHLLHALPTETIKIHLNTQGGSLETGVAIINAMLSTQAEVVCILEGQAFSLGALIFLCGNTWIVHDHTLIMFHNYSGESWGKGNEIMAHMKAQEKWHMEITKEIYQPFLTSEEYDRLLKGEDFWLHPSEIRTRLKRVVKEHNKKNNDSKD
jgi:ATP-dependent protease ClpP protease subunit